jgi:hypothetical protein
MIGLASQKTVELASRLGHAGYIVQMGPLKVEVAHNVTPLELTRHLLLLHFIICHSKSAIDPWTY